MTTPQERLQAAKDLLQKIVCTEGEDKGVILVDHESPTYWDDQLKCYVYKYEHFSPLGDALIELWEILQEGKPPSEEPSIGQIIQFLTASRIVVVTDQVSREAEGFSIDNDGLTVYCTGKPVKVKMKNGS